MSAQPKSYAIRRLSYFTHLAAVSAIAVFALVGIFIPEGPTVDKATVWVLVLFFLFTLYGVYTFVAMPQYITVTPTGALTFRSYLGTRVISPTDLTEVTTESMGYYVVFRFGNAKVKLLNRIDGLYELLSSLKAQKPDLVIKGL
jgi:hypothetical protein